MSEINTTTDTTVTTKTADYFNLTLKGLGYLSHIRQVNHQNGSFLCCVINALSGPTDNPTYVRFDVCVAGKEATSLIARCHKAVDEDKKVLLGFTLSNPSTDIFTLNKGEHAGEHRVSLKARLIKVDWIKVGQVMAYKAEKSDTTPPQSDGTLQREYAENSF
ncbi:STY4534 family ICE replication protein [Serratia microhaemolytica]|uniref:STY4534 family ICE replication protein n=1 Tax=Serratia microhaemolytica TaxID=2675110 RepID=UPI000FDED436|nr:STY4534 family ICE replication protein [Serratia microhaemolytica]